MHHKECMNDCMKYEMVMMMYIGEGVGRGSERREKDEGDAGHKIR